MANSISSKEFPERTRKAVEDILKKHHISGAEIGHEWDIRGFILREELVRQGSLEKYGQLAHEVAQAAAREEVTAAAAAAAQPQPVAGFLPNKRIILGFIHAPKVNR